MKDDELNLANAIRYSCSVVKKWTKNGSVRIPELSEDFKRARSIFQPVKVRVGLGEEEFRGFQIKDDKAAADLSIAYDRDPDAAMLIREYLTINVFLGTPLPPLARLLASRIMGGENGARITTKPKLTHRDTLLRGLVFRIRERWGFDLAYNPKNATRDQDGPPPRCGSEIVAASLREYGVNLKSDTAATLVHNRRDLQSLADENSFVFFGDGPNIGILAALLDKPSDKDDVRTQNVFRYFGISPKIPF